MRYTHLLTFFIIVVMCAGCGKRSNTDVIEQDGMLQVQTSSPKTPQPVSQPQTRKMTKMPLEEARGRAPFKVLEPVYLPPGAGYVETRYIEFDGQVFVVLQYEFEGKKIYFQVDEYSPTVVEMELPDAQNVQIGDYEGMAIFQHGFTVIRWTQNGTRLMLNGAIDQSEALKVALSFK